MTHVHYKFSSKLSYDTVVFDDPRVTLKDLKRQIMGREKLRAGDCDLQITNAQSKEEYKNDDSLIPKGSSVIVRRIPVIGAKSSSNSKTHNIERSDVQSHHIFGAFKAMDDQNSSGVLPLFSKMANLADVDVSEEDKLKVMMNQSYDSMNYNKFGTVLPANYTCYRCGNTGHHIRNCPTSGDKTFEAPLRIKKSSGIPRSFMVEVDDPNIKGAMLTNCGRYAIPSIDIEAYAIGKKEKPPFLSQEQLKSEDKEEPVPEELLCLICHDLLSDAVVIPCCGNSYCDDCIRTALLDSEEHVCPTCSQSDVSPDTLIGNKFLRQAVDNFKKERGYIKSLRRKCGTSQSQNPTQTPNPIPTPPLVAVQSQPQKPQLSTHSQQDPLLQRSQAADTPPSSRLCMAPPTATGPASALNTPSTSLQPVQSHLEIPDKEAEEKTWNDSRAAAAPSVPISPKDPADAPSQLIPLVNPTPVVEQPQTVSVNPQQPPSGPASVPSGTFKSWDSSSSSSGCPTGGWNESNTQQIPPSVSSYTTPPPLFPSPHFHPFLAAQQPLSSYPSGYPPTTPVWTLPNLQGAPIPSLCSSTPIPALIPKEWYRHQRKKERSPHRGSSRRSSSSRSNSKSSKSKSSRSYSRSSSRSRSRSRSRSQGRSRPHSPYSHHRDLHTRSHSSRSYSYGYKRSPTLSSSSSPRVGYHSRPRSPSDHRKNSHHSRHYNKRSASSSSSSRRRGEHYQRDVRGSRKSLASYPYAQHANQSSSLELDRERYLQWEREYKEWCDKYFSSYVGHFHQLPVPLLSLPPPQWGEREGSRIHASSDSCNQLQGRHTTRMDGRSPPSQSSSDSRSPPSRSSCDSRSTPSQSSRDSRSTLSQSSSDSRSSPCHSSNNSRSPPSRSSSDRHSTPSEDRAHPREYQQKCKEKYGRLSVTHTKGSKEVEMQERSKDDKQPIMRSFENIANLKHEQKSMKKHEEGRGEESSSPDAADSTDDCRKDKRRHSTGPNTCKGATPAQNEATGSDALESVQPLATPDKRLDEDYKRKKRAQKDLETEKERRRGNGSDSRQDLGRQHKEKPSKEADRMDADRYPGGSKASDWRSEKNRKRKGDDNDSSVRAESSKCLKTNTIEDPKRSKSESLNPFDRKKPKMEKKTWPLVERDIWEGGIKVKPQKKISININLEGRRKDEKTESGTGKTKESEKAGDGEVEKLNSRDIEIEANVKTDSSRDLEEEKNKVDEGEARQKWETATFSDDKEGKMLQESAGEKKDIGEKREDREKEFGLDFALRAMKEEKKVSKKQWDERDRTEACKGEEVTNDKRRSVRGGKEGQVTGELVAVIQKEKTEEDSTCKEDRGNPPGEAKPKEELMEESKWRMRKEEEEDTMESQRSRNESHHDRPNATVDDGSSSEDRQERKTVVKTVEEYTQDRAADREDELVLIQVPRSKWEKEESEEEERDEGVIKVQPNALTTCLPSPSVSVTAETTTNRETEIEEKRERSVEMERGRDREREKSPILSTSHTSVAPSSGKDRSDSALFTDREGEKGMKMERWRNRDRGSERDRQKESKRSKERTREEEKGRDRDRERGHSSIASAQKKNLPSSSSHSYSYSTSHDTERRDSDKKSSSCPGGKSSGGRSRESRAPEAPDQNTHKSYRDTLLYSKFKDKDLPHCFHNRQDPSGNYRPAGTRHSPPSEWKMQQVVKEGKGERGNEEMVAEREGGSQRDDKANELDGQTKRRGMRELEEGERPSSRSNSVSSSASQENSGDDGRKERKKKQKQKKEKRRGAPEMLEEGELKRHKHKKKTSKKSRDGKEEKSNEEVDDHTKLCSVMLS